MATETETKAQPAKSYLGDSVYARFDYVTGNITLTTENGYGASNTVVLEPEVLHSFLSFYAKFYPAP